MSRPVVYFLLHHALRGDWAGSTQSLPKISERPEQDRLTEHQLKGVSGSLLAGRSYHFHIASLSEHRTSLQQHQVTREQPWIEILQNFDKTLYLSLPFHSDD